MEDKYILAVVCIGSLTIIEVCALMHGLNGQLYLSVVGAVSGIFGASIGLKIKQSLDDKKGQITL